MIEEADGDGDGEIDFKGEFRCAYGAISITDVSLPFSASRVQESRSPWSIFSVHSLTCFCLQMMGL